jgi:predicted RNase H-like HicB family nuclease
MLPGFLLLIRLNCARMMPRVILPMPNVTPRTRPSSKRRRASLNFQITILVEPDENGFHAYCPSLPGLHVPGATVQDALENARVAAQLFLECMIEDGDAIPLGVHPGAQGKPQEGRRSKEAVHVEDLLIHLE